MDFFWRRFSDGQSVTKADWENEFPFFQEYLELQFLLPVGSIDAILCPDCGEHDAILTNQDGKTFALCIHGSATMVETSDSQLYSVDRNRVLSLIQSQLTNTKPGSLHRRNGAIYELGDILHRGKNLKLFCVPDLSSPARFDAVIALLKEVRPGLVLTAETVPSESPKGSGHRFVPIAEVCECREQGIDSDRAALEFWFDSIPRKYQYDQPNVISWQTAVDQVWKERMERGLVRSTLKAEVEFLVEHVPQVFLGVSMRGRSSVSQYISERHRRFRHSGAKFKSTDSI